jgi:hypothetical protein
MPSTSAMIARPIAANERETAQGPGVHGRTTKGWSLKFGVSRLRSVWSVDRCCRLPGTRAREVRFCRRVRPVMVSTA